MEQNREDPVTIIPNPPNMNSLNDSKLKLEMTLLYRKYIRLEQKQKRIQVKVLLKVLIVLFYRFFY